MSIGCVSIDQHNCIQIADENLTKILDDLKLEKDALVLDLPSSNEAIKLSSLFWQQQARDIVLVVREGSCKIIDDFSFDRNIQIVALGGSEFRYSFELKKSCEFSLKLFLYKGAFIQVSGVYKLNKKHCVKILTEQHHLEPNASSNLMVKGVVEDEAEINYVGKIFVNESAYGSVVSQKNKTLILSEAAKAVSIPSMEVLNKDVQCAHGAAIAHVDQDQMFYLQSRGFEPAQAKKLIIQSFLDS